ncbi:MAG: chromate transporter [Peptoniphilus sp.]|nr:chromate transporter [Peptoniphilus sp.]MDD7363484.1 chromate transporter [Bacillota bacterium]MDY6044812.1 chromate transporter [Peptoniphilus sp.]
MQLLKLLFIFFKVGLFSFGGGYATIPLIQQYIVEGEQWLTMTQFTDLVTISQMTPGPIAINSATFVGAQVAGVPGSIVATVGVTMPQSIVMLALGYYLFTKQRTFKIMDMILRGIKAGIIGLIFIASCYMLQNALWPDGGGFEVVALVTFIIGFYLYHKHVDLIRIIAIGAILGIILKLVLTLL